jgi:hypothetical protein
MAEARIGSKEYWFRRTFNGGVQTNVRRRVTHHSPDGFEFGYGGSGPADLALNILEDALHSVGYQGPVTQCWGGQCYGLAYSLHQAFKWDFIARVPRDRGTSITLQQILDWMEKKGVTIHE